MPRPTHADSSILAYYITAHGFGHGARSCDILSALLRARPDLTLHVVTDLPPDFLSARLPPGDVRYRPGRFDAGMVQLDSIRVDVDASLRAATELADRSHELANLERLFMIDERVGAVVCDIPAIPLIAAGRAGLPALAVGNFAWDWIYEEFVERDPDWEPVVETFREAYRASDLLLRLPFAEPMAAFLRRRDLPLVARPGRNRRAEMARQVGLRDDRPWVLLSFTTLEWDEAALRRVQALRGYEFLTVLPLRWEGPNLHAIDRRVFSYSDVLASSDIVLTKPGYGVLSECAVNGKPMVYTERTDFREYPVLEAAVRRYFRHQHLPARDLYRGDLQDALEAVQRAPAPRERLATGGDDEAARIILRYLDHGSPGRVLVDGPG